MLKKMKNINKTKNDDSKQFEGVFLKKIILENFKGYGLNIQNLMKLILFVKKRAHIVKAKSEASLKFSSNLFYYSIFY